MKKRHIKTKLFPEVHFVSEFEAITIDKIK